MSNERYAIETETLLTRALELALCDVELDDDELPYAQEIK